MSIRSSARIIAVAALGLGGAGAFTACSYSSSSPGQDGGAGPGGAGGASTTSTGTGGTSAGSGGAGEASTMIGSEGGTLVAEGGVEVHIPPGALTKETELSVIVFEQLNGLPPLGAGLGIDSPIVALLPHGTHFARPVAVTIPHRGFGNSVHRLADESDPDWERVENVSMSPFAATFETDTFSFYVATRHESETVYDYPLPTVTVDGVPYRTSSEPVYDRGSAFWMEREEGILKFWRLRLDAAPGTPTLIVSKPWLNPGLSMYPYWITETHLVWLLSSDDEFTGVASVAKDGSGYREDLPNMSPVFPRGAGLVMFDYKGNTSNEPDVYEVSPATGSATALPSALAGLSRDDCLYDAVNDKVGCIVGGLTTDGPGGYGVETFDFQTGARQTLGRTEAFILANIRQNADHWFAASVSGSYGITVWPKAGGAHRLFDAGGDWAAYYAADDEAFYMCRSLDLVRVAVSDFTETRLTPGCDRVIGVDGDHVYFLGRDEASSGLHYLFKRFRKD